MVILMQLIHSSLGNLILYFVGIFAFLFLFYVSMCFYFSFFLSIIVYFFVFVGFWLSVIMYKQIMYNNK